MRIIAVANQKGGCGKTTTAINLSSCLAIKGQRVLLIDFDPQAHATMGLGVDFDPEKSMYHVMGPRGNGCPSIENVAVPVKEGLDIAPSDTKLSAIEQELNGVEGRENRLMEAINELNEEYDFVIIDCPPSIGHLSFNALRASDEAIIPIDMSLFSLKGVEKLTEMISLLEDSCGHIIKARAVVTMYDFRTRYAREVLDKVKEKFKDRVFSAVIRYNIRLRETVDHGLPVGDYDKHAIGQKDYEELAEEVMSSTIASAALEEDDSGNFQDDITSETEETSGAIYETQALKANLPGFDEIAQYRAQSSYSSMIESIRTNVSDQFQNVKRKWRN